MERERQFWRGCRLFNVLDDVKMLSNRSLKKLVK